MIQQAITDARATAERAENRASAYLTATDAVVDPQGQELVLGSVYLSSTADATARAPSWLDTHLVTTAFENVMGHRPSLYRAQHPTDPLLEATLPFLPELYPVDSINPQQLRAGPSAQPLPPQQPQGQHNLSLATMRAAPEPPYASMSNYFNQPIHFLPPTIGPAPTRTYYRPRVPLLSPIPTTTHPAQQPPIMPATAFNPPGQSAAWTTNPTARPDRNTRKKGRPLSALQQKRRQKRNTGPEPPGSDQVGGQTFCNICSFAVVEVARHVQSKGARERWECLDWGSSLGARGVVTGEGSVGEGAGAA